MQQGRDGKRDRCSKLVTRTVIAFLECLNLRHSSSSSDMVKAKARNEEEEEEEEEASSVETSTRSLKLASKRTRKQPVSSGKRGGVNNYDI